MKWVRSQTPTGVPVYSAEGTEFSIVARMSRSRIVGSRLVFGQVVTEGDHRPRAEAWEIMRAERFIGRREKLSAAKALVERMAA